MRGGSEYILYKMVPIFKNEIAVVQQNQTNVI